MSASSPDELFELFDESNRSLQTLMPRKQVHREGHRHRSTNIFLVNGKGLLLLQRRVQAKVIAPGCWDVSVAEHVQPNEAYEAAAVRGVREELDMEIPLSSLTPLGEAISLDFDDEASEVHDHEWCQLFLAQTDLPPTPDLVEVAEVRFEAVESVQRRLQEEPESFTPWFAPSFHRFMVWYQDKEKRAEGK